MSAPDFAGVAAVLGLYFDGLYHSDTRRLARVFHPKAQYVCVTEGTLLYRDMADAQAGRVRGHVTSAAPLSSEALEGVRTALQQLTQRNVVLETRVDPSLLGGVSAQVGSLLYDGSLKTQLELMRRELKRH